MMEAIRNPGLAKGLRKIGDSEEIRRMSITYY